MSEAQHLLEELRAERAVKDELVAALEATEVHTCECAFDPGDKCQAPPSDMCVPCQARAALQRAREVG